MGKEPREEPSKIIRTVMPVDSLMVSRWGFPAVIGLFTVLATAFPPFGFIGTILLLVVLVIISYIAKKCERD